MHRLSSALCLIAFCLGKTMERMVKSGRGFDERHYQERLGELPLKTEE